MVSRQCIHININIDINININIHINIYIYIDIDIDIDIDSYLVWYIVAILSTNALIQPFKPQQNPLKAFARNPIIQKTDAKP